MHFLTETGTQGLQINKLGQYIDNPHQDIFNGLGGSHSVGFSPFDALLDRFVYSSWFNVSEELSYVEISELDAANIEEHVLLRLGGASSNGGTPLNPEGLNNLVQYAPPDGQYARVNLSNAVVPSSPNIKSNQPPFSGTDGYEFKIIANSGTDEDGEGTFKFWFGVMLPNGEAAWWCSSDSFNYTQAPSGPPARMQSGWYHTAIEWNPSPTNFQGEFTATYSPTLYVNGTRYVMTQQTNPNSPNQSGAYVTPQSDPSYMFVDKNLICVKLE